MPFQKYVPWNNAQGQLIAGISAGSTTFILQSWQGDRFPSTFPFLVEIKNVDTVAPYAVLKREIVKVTGRTWDTFTGTRSAGTCLPDDASNTPGTTAFSFSTGDIVTLTVTAETIKDIQDELTTKLATIAGLRTGFGTDKHVRVNRSTGAEEIKNVNTGVSLASTDIIRVEKSGWDYEDILFPIFQNSLAPSSLAVTLDKYLIEDVSTNNPISFYKVPQTSETPIGYINVWDVAGSSIQTIYDVSTGTSGNSVSFYTDKVSAANNLVIRAVTVDGSGIATTTQVHANALQSVAPASVTAAWVTTITFPGSFTCGAAGTKFAWQICQWTFGSPVVSWVTYYKVWFNTGSSLLFAENTATMSASVAGTTSTTYGAYMVAKRRVSVRGFTSYVSLVWVNVKYGIIPKNAGSAAAPNTYLDLSNAVTITTTTGTTHTFPQPVILEQWQTLVVALVANWSYNYHNPVGLTDPNPDIQYLWHTAPANWAGCFNGFLTKWVGEVERTSTMADTYHLRKWNSDDALLLVNHTGFSAWAYTFWQIPKVNTEGNISSSSLTPGALYNLSGNTFSTESGVYQKAVWRAISTSIISVNSLTKGKNLVYYGVVVPMYAEWNIRYLITTAGASTYTLEYSYDLKTWKTIEVIQASTSVDRVINLPPCFIRWTITGTISTNIFYL